MSHVRTACLVLLAAALAVPASAQEVEPIRIALHPAAPAGPALRYHLLPQLHEMAPGNAADLYKQAIAELKKQTDALTKEYADKLFADRLAALDVSLCALGSGERAYEQLFRRLTSADPARFGNWIGYNNAMAHKIEAGADLFLMPSRYEPCGLNQIYSLKYGTLPVVRATGGLDDTIDEGTGFKFWEYAGSALLGALERGLAAWEDRERWNAMMRNAMRWRSVKRRASMEGSAGNAALRLVWRQVHTASYSIQANLVVNWRTPVVSA